MKYPKWFTRLRWIFLILMCVHVGVAMLGHAIYLKLGGHSWDPPVVQLCWVMAYLPLWFVAEGIRMVLRFRGLKSGFGKFWSVFIFGFLFLMIVLCVVSNLSFLPYCTFPQFLFSMFVDALMYSPVIVIVYAMDLMFTFAFFRQE